MKTQNKIYQPVGSMQAAVHMPHQEQATASQLLEGPVMGLVGYATGTDSGDLLTKLTVATTHDKHM